MKKFIWHIYRKINKLPRMVCLEACSICQLNCPDCHMRKNDSDLIVGNGYLKFKDFKKFVDKNPYIESIELSFCGEIFLNPELLEIIKYAHKKNIKLTAFNGVNFNNVSNEIMEALVKYKFTGITLSIDGTTNETYQIYRRNGNLNNVINNIKKLNELKEKYNSKFPILEWQYIVFKHNEHEISKVEELQKQLKIDYVFFKQPWNSSNFSIRAISEIQKNKIEPLFDTEIEKILNENKIDLCLNPWLQPQINWDGRLLGCFCSTHNDLGVNVFEVGLKAALSSPKSLFMRSVLSGKQRANESLHCLHCSFYRNMRKNNEYINPKLIKFI